LGVNVTLAIPNSKALQESPQQAIAQMMNRKVDFQVKTFDTITIGSRLSMMGGYWGAKRLLKSVNADFCMLRNPVFVGLVLAKGLPMVFECHRTRLHDKHRTLDYFWRRKLVESSKTDMFRKFVVISKALAHHWINAGVPANKVVALHDGVDAHQYSVVYDQDSMRNKLGLPNGPKIVVYAGSLYENRGIENIVKLAVFFPEALFVVVGGPEEVSNIVFTGYVAHHKVKDYLFASDVLLMLWTKEVKTINGCSPLKMFEYMGAGRIIVGHAFPTIKEVLKDGENAYLVDHESFDDLCGKMKLALRQSYPNAMAKRARELAINTYSWEARATRLLKSIGVICGDKDESY
jgi:glycosyltransferase involved in cell wall biosynthesis